MGHRKPWRGKHLYLNLSFIIPLIIYFATYQRKSYNGEINHLTASQLIVEGPLNRKPIKLSSQSGNGIDRFMLEKLMNGIKFRGTFVEFGCADGITNSNTWPLEQLGWFGLCIEANPVSYKTAKARRRNVIQSLIGPSGHFTYVSMAGDCEQLSGIKEFYSVEFMELYESCKNSGLLMEESTVTTQPLDDILGSFHMTDVTYISADCEGCEYSFIKSFNFTAYDVQVFNYEDNTVARQYKTEIDKILGQHGFTLVFEAGDRLFVRNSMVLEE